MKPLFDHNLSTRLVQRLDDLCPGASHTAFVGLDRASDTDVWTFARTHGYTIVTKDSDFSDLSVLHGSPPKVIWLRLGNCTTADVERALRHSFATIVDFLADPAVDVLELG